MSCMCYQGVLSVGLSEWELYIGVSLMLLRTLAIVTASYRILSMKSTMSLLLVSIWEIVLLKLVKLDLFLCDQ